MPALEELQVLGKQKLQDQQTLCQVMCCHHWSIPTQIFLADYKSLESPPLSASHSCQNLCVSWDPSGYKTEYFWEALLIILWFWRQINYFTVFKEGWRDVKSGSLQSFGELWGIWLKDLDVLQDRGLLGCSMMVLAVSPSGWSLCSHCADVKCRSHCSVGAGVGLLHSELRGHVREHPLWDSEPQHCRHSWERDSSENLGVPPSSQRALQGVGLLSSHTEPLLPSFSLSDSTVCSALLSLAAILQPVCALFLSSSLTVSWIGNSLEQVYSCQMHRHGNRFPWLHPKFLNQVDPK